MASTVGELLMVRVGVEARDLEEVLETLAGLDFPVNPELYPCGALTTIEFPTYAHQLEEIYLVLPVQAQVEAISMLAEIGLYS